MMNSAVTQTLTNIGGCHNADAESMLQAALNVRRLVGFENYGVPFCLTVEAEEFGAAVDYGGKDREARVVRYREMPLEESVRRWSGGEIDTIRSSAVLKTIGALRGNTVPVVGNLTGHISVATSIYEPASIFRLFRKDPPLLKRYLGVINDYLRDFAMKMIDAGADIIAVSDPTATGEILGARYFSEFAVPVYRDLFSAVHARGVPVILHICGAADNIVREMESSGADALSFDSTVGIRRVKSITAVPVMGNVSTHLLSGGTPEAIRSAAEFALKSGVDIAAPACGIGMETSVENLRAMVDAVTARAPEGVRIPCLPR
jgi:[methyl-Co(III) methanol-specific corrinoid protein]:coenzyme M methyltransferase